MGGMGGGDAWVRVKCVCVCVCVCKCVCVWWLGGDYKVRHQLNLCLRAQTWEMKKVVGVIFFYFFFFFVTIPIQQWPTTETWEGQTNRLTHRRTHNTYTHTYCTQKYILSNNHELTGNQSHSISRTDEWAHGRPLWKHTACRLKWQRWEWGENRMATTIETAWGARRNTPATADCWHTNTQSWAC